APEHDYTAEKIEAALTHYEEYLTSQTDEFMERFNRSNNDEVDIVSFKEQTLRHISSVKKISYNV
ncbi:MAG: hypothetical protein ABS873_06915, partial [Alkalibacterium sp.]